MRMISHPMRLDSAGAVVTMDDDSDRAAAELAGHVLSCRTGERPLAPPYGLREVDPATVAGTIAWCEPEIRASGITLTDPGPGRIGIRVDVEWSES